MSRPGRNLILCLDGTGNQFKEDNSNVVKLFRVLDRGADADGAIFQKIYYDGGVGTLPAPHLSTPLARKISSGLGLAFGAGLRRDVEEAYSFLMEEYEPGDQVFLFGFSRGAYTARVLAGFIHRCGLLEPGCQNLIPYATRLFRRKQPDFKVLGRFKSVYSRPCPIHFLGLWDSVSAYGWVTDPIFMPNTSNNPSVRSVRHALAIDERRAFFRALHWGDEPDDTVEVWFSGVHSDVGGGYPEEESGLAKISLEWMIGEALQAGLRVDPVAYGKYVQGEHEGKRYKHYVGPGFEGLAGRQHESLTWKWMSVQFLPQRIWDPDRMRRVFQWFRGRRVVPDGATLHESVVRRVESDGYAPVNLVPRGLDGAAAAKELRRRFDVVGSRK